MLPGFGFPIVIPAHHRRQAHQDRLGTPAALQSEKRAAVPQQIEFHISAAPELKGPFPFSVRCLFAPGYNRKVAVKVGVADATGEGEGTVESEMV